ncbi:hypothetical protein BDN70DRAFT_876691 [Pholiota conissans]|uniref:Phytocyanin domain-containing protein n=1 Tax=Pholiota conissans TaxID=109636 RepID=A0A9P5Z873_9AGAR|nr:hypothetical protein BDN70DRAFT_876691 [Pholiota conissans]
MHFFPSAVLAVSALVSVASATNHSVTIGQDSKLTFEPNTLTGVQSGDFVSFKFVSKNHTVTQSTFAAPCIAKDGGVNSGYTPVAADATAFPEWTIQIDNASTPLWFFCEQGAHCKAGMVFAINPTADKSFATFLATATGAASNTTTTTNGTTTGTTGTGSTTTTSDNTTTSGTPAAGSGALTLSARTASSLLAGVGIAVALVL